MTCIVGVARDGHVVIGGDSSANGSKHLRDSRADPKVFRLGRVIFGCSGSFRMTQLLHHRLKLPRLPAVDVDDEELDAWMTRQFVERVRAAFDAGGWTTGDREQRATPFLVGIRGRLYAVDQDLQAGRSLDGYFAIGSGEAVGLGALYAGVVQQLEQRELVELALSAAAYHVGSVAGPFTILEETA